MWWLEPSHQEMSYNSMFPGTWSQVYRGKLLQHTNHEAKAKPCHCIVLHYILSFHCKFIKTEMDITVHLFPK